MENIFKELVDQSDARWKSRLRRASNEPPKQDPPKGFATSYLVGRPVPYLCCNEVDRNDGSGGVLAVGTIIWLTRVLSESDRNRTVVGWTEATGLVHVKTQELVVLRRR